MITHLLTILREVRKIFRRRCRRSRSFATSFSRFGRVFGDRETKTTNRRVARRRNDRSSERGNQLLGRTAVDSRKKNGESGLGGTPSVPSPSAHLVGVRGVDVRRPGFPDKADVSPVAIDRDPKWFGGKVYFETRRRSDSQPAEPTRHAHRTPIRSGRYLGKVAAA